MHIFAVISLLLLFAVKNGDCFCSYRRPLIQVSHRMSPFHQAIRRVWSKDEVINDGIDETTKQYGLDAFLLKASQEREKGESKAKATDMLKKFGIAYLATSITLAIVSYALCYFLVANGIDVAALLEKVGIKATANAANVGTAGIAYAIHKAASPIRFPPTVALTPVVAGWLGRKPSELKAK